MRLPRSSSQPLSLRLTPVILLTVCLALLVPGARATQSRQLVCSPASLRFGAVALGQLETQLITLTNNGQTSITISAISASNSEFAASGLTLPAALAAGQSVTVNVTFTPDNDGWTSGQITFTSSASNPNLELLVQGSGVGSDEVTATPSSLSFGQVAVGSSAALSVVLTNERNWKVTLQSAQIVGSGFSFTGASFPLVLAGRTSVTLDITFQPQAAGTTGGSIFIPGPGLNIPLAGTGTTVGQLTLSPTTLSFGNVDVGSTTTQASTLNASGGSVTISSATSNNSEFSVSGISFPVTIAAGQSLTFDAVFSPSQTGSASGTLTFASNASDSQVGESVNGTGVNPQYSVNLSWNASNSNGVVGYNVYRGTVANSYTKINPSLDGNTSYTDNTVSPVVNYYYAATSVNSSGQESGYSSPIEVSVP